MYVGRVAKELKEAGWEVYAVCLRDTRVDQYMRKEGVDSLAFPTVWHSVVGFYRVVSWMKKNGVKVVHCHKSSDLRLALLIKLFFKDVRFFFTDHVGSTRSKKDFYHRMAYGILDKVFSISHSTYERNIRNLPVDRDRVTCLHHGVDVDKYSPYPDEESRSEKRKRLGIPSDTVVVGVPGRVTPGKGQELWLRAVSRLPRELPFLAFIIGGTSRSDGGVEECYNNLVGLVEQEGLSGKVRFLGHRDDLDEILPALDVICIPSRNEAFGLTVIESMASGVAVIGSRSGSLPELLGDDSGVLVGVEDVQAWTAAMEELIRDKGRRLELGRLARNRAVYCFSKGQHLQKLIAFYSEI